MEHQSFFPSRQVHLVSTSGVPTLNGQTKADLTFFFNSPVVYIPSSYDCLISCVSASIPYVWGNIDSTNKVFGFTLAGVAYSATLSVGTYSIDNILAVLTAKLPVLTYAYSANTRLVTISHPTLNFTLTDASLSPYLGFTTMTSTGCSLTSTVQVNFIKTTSVFVETPELVSETFDSRTRGQSGIVCRVPVQGSPGNLLVWTNILGTSTKLPFKQINHIRLRLLDDAQNVLDLGTYVWTVTLQFSIVEATSFIDGDWLHSEPKTTT